MKFSFSAFAFFLNVAVVSGDGLRAYSQYDFRRNLGGKPKAGGGGCHDCSCFTCDTYSSNHDGTIDVTIGHCKDGSISWMCCTAVDGVEGACETTGPCTPAAGEEKCESIEKGEGLVITIPAKSKTFTINTHDGQTAGDADMNNNVCGGNGNQGGKCADKDGPVTAHCLVEFDLVEDCGFTPEDTPAPTPSPGPEDETPAPTPADPEDETPAPTPSDPEDETPAPTPDDPEDETPAPTPHEPTKPPTYMSGDPHIKKFNGESYDFHGGCDLVLLENPAFNNGQGLRVHVRTKITRWWSSIESAVIQIGDDTLEVKAGISYHPHWINGKLGEFDTSQNFPFTVGGFHGRYRYKNDKILQYKIFLTDDQSVTIRSIKDMLRVELEGAEAKDFGKSLGLMGSYETGKLLGRDGVTIHDDANAFGLAWQVRDTDPQLFHEKDGPQYPQACDMPQTEGAAVGRRLAASISKEAAQKACANADKGDFKNCVYDVIAMDDVDAAQGY